MVKLKISVAVEEDTLDIIQDFIKDKRFRNRSHAFEYAIHSLEKERRGELK